MSQTDARGDLARRIAQSLAIGDHNDVDKPLLRAVLGLMILVCAGLRRAPRASSTLGDVDGAHVVANPVAHGARFAAAVKPALPPKYTIVADLRLSDDSVGADFSFPSLAPQSMAAVATTRRLGEAIRLRRHAGQLVNGGAKGPRLYREYLFLAQAIRYSAVRDLFASSARNLVVLADFDRCAYAAPWIDHANDRGWETASLVHGSPSEATYLPSRAGHTLVWGEVQSQWYRARSPQTIVHIVGRPDIEDADASMMTLPRLIVCHSLECLTEYEQREISAHLAAARANGIRSLLRLHPIAASLGAGETWGGIVEQAENVVTAGAALAESLHRNDTVLAVTSSAVVDALGRGVNVLVVASPTRALPADVAALAAEQAEVGQVDVVRRERYIAARGAASQRLIRQVLDGLRMPSV